ncbi:flagellar hook capping FlgD N-terminal domain-containing protein [Pseudotabrizicola sp. L79]|uniref:flagellar hook capping FlgD N-terminal domain-containing protein n=1 Tax=Pseudotabrizicola sp. L79 TaxID=3118402 RepID=UPI002F947183
MDITQITAASQSGKTVASSSALSSDFETFLKMLTTQMQNQDPLNPIEASDYAVQLATFSNVEQSVRTNQLLEAMQQQFGVLSMSQLAGWVGQEARAAGPVHLVGQPITLSANPAATADRVMLVIRDSAGTIVSREEMPVSADAYEWIPLDATGAPLPQGLYTITAESYYGDSLLMTNDVEHYARILEARGGLNGTRLVLSGGVEIAATDITALRVPTTP